MTASFLITFLISLALGIAIGAISAWLIARARVRADYEVRLARAETTSNLLTERATALEADAAVATELTTAVGPLAAGVKDLRDQVSTQDRQRIAEIARLSEHITHLAAQNRELHASTVRLSNALHSTSQRGNWGEIQLKRIVEYAGLLPHVDFDTQVTVTVNDSTYRPDMVINIPGGGNIVVDAKAPLSSRLKEDTLKRDSETNTDHARSLLRHVDALASKRYWQAFEHAPEFVVCFVPTDGLLSSAASAYPQLIDQALAKNVVLASPSTLLVLLKTVAMNWRHYDIGKSAATIVALGQELYERTGHLTDRVTKLGSALDKAVGEYNSFIGSLETRFLVTARKFSTTGVTSKELSELKTLDAHTRAPNAREMFH